MQKLIQATAKLEILQSLNYISDVLADSRQISPFLLEAIKNLIELIVSGLEKSVYGVPIKEDFIVKDLSLERLASLLKSQRILDTIIENAPKIVFVAFDSQGVFLDVQGLGIERILKKGETKQRSVGKSVYELYAHDLKTLDGISTCLQGEPAKWTTVVAGVTYDIAGSPILDDENNVESVVCVGVDVTAISEALEVKKELNWELSKRVKGSIQFVIELLEKISESEPQMKTGQITDWLKVLQFIDNLFYDTGYSVDIQLFFEQLNIFIGNESIKISENNFALQTVTVEFGVLAGLLVYELSQDYPIEINIDLFQKIVHLDFQGATNSIAKELIKGLGGVIPPRQKKISIPLLIANNETNRSSKTGPGKIRLLL